MKKVLGFILAFMVLAFSVIPCSDDVAFEKSGTKYELSQSIPQDNDQDYRDACSPFCICSCCAGFSAVSKLPTTLTVIIPFQSIHTPFISERLHSLALPIWQPPQLV